jgi:signal transduction histidine kinase
MTGRPANFASAVAQLAGSDLAAGPDLAPLIDGVSDLVAVVVGDQVAYINQAGVKLLGYTAAAQVVGQRLDTFLDPRAVYAPLLRKQEQEKGTSDTDLWVRAPIRCVNGKVIEAEVRPVLLPERNALAIVAHATDALAILDADAPAAALHAADGLKQLVANMAHELRTPLNAIIGFSEIIAQRMFGEINDRYAAYATDILASGQHLLRIINDILDYAKVESGEVLLRLEKASVTDTIRAGVRLLVAQAERSGVEVADELADVLPLIAIDPTKVKQIVVNLIGNAIKFTPRGGRVVVGSKALNERTIEVWVKDTGVGMTEAEAADALLPFRQPKAPPDGSYAGTGLGLPIAKALVALHGGNLRIVSAPNQGTEVRFTVLHQDQKGTAPAKRPGV